MIPDGRGRGRRPALLQPVRVLGPDPRPVLRAVHLLLLRRRGRPAAAQGAAFSYLPERFAVESVSRHPDADPAHGASRSAGWAMKVINSSVPVCWTGTSGPGAGDFPADSIRYLLRVRSRAWSSPGGPWSQGQSRSWGNRPGSAFSPSNGVLSRAHTFPSGRSAPTIKSARAARRGRPRRVDPRWAAGLSQPFGLARPDNGLTRDPGPCPGLTGLPALRAEDTVRYPGNA